MTRFNTRSARPTGQSPITTTGEHTQTFEGGAAYTRDAKSDLLLLAVTNMVGQDSFYEDAQSRDDRYTGLVRQVAVADPQWMADFLRWLRQGANMRSAALVAAAEAVKARLDHDDALLDPAEGPGFSRQFVNAVLQRADEPGEFLGYWTGKYGRSLPKPVKRGVSDAVRRLYTEYSLLKYDTARHGFRFADVLELTHASPREAAAWQGDLFKHAIDRRHGHDSLDEIPASLLMVIGNKSLRELPEATSAWLNSGVLKGAGMTWEDVLSAQGDRIDKAKLWEALIPSMGYMALLRNLRNFDEAGIDDNAVSQVVAKLVDPVQVARSRQFPYRFLSAQRTVPSQRWGYALDTALQLSVQNIPAFPGRTLVLVDTSASMRQSVSDRSKIRHVDVGALFGVALAARGADVDLHGFAGSFGGGGGAVQFKHELTRGGSVLRQTEAFCARIGEVGHGTETVEALRQTFKGHDRVVVFSDMQAFRDYYGHDTVSTVVPADVPLFGVNTSGYAPSSIDTSKSRRYEVGGFSDKMFTMVDLLSRGHNSGWPWEN